MAGQSEEIIVVGEMHGHHREDARIRAIHADDVEALLKAKNLSSTVPIITLPAL